MAVICKLTLSKNNMSTIKKGHTIQHAIRLAKKEMQKDMLGVYNKRTYYNSLLDSIFYCMEDLEQMQKLLLDKEMHLLKLQAKARLVDLEINLEHGIFNNSTIPRSAAKKLLKIEVQHAKKLSSLPKNVPTKRKKQR
jgi:hypothetical protein